MNFTELLTRENLAAVSTTAANIIQANRKPNASDVVRTVNASAPAAVQTPAEAVPPKTPAKPWMKWVWIGLAILVPGGLIVWALSRAGKKG